MECYGLSVDVWLVGVLSIILQCYLFITYQCYCFIHCTISYLYNCLITAFLDEVGYLGVSLGALAVGQQSQHQALQH